MEQETFPATDLFYQGLGNSIAIRKETVGIVIFLQHVRTIMEIKNKKKTTKTLKFNNFLNIY